VNGDITSISTVNRPYTGRQSPMPTIDPASRANSSSSVRSMISGSNSISTESTQSRNMGRVRMIRLRSTTTESTVRKFASFHSSSRSRGPV
jgi:hypothetical protein